VSVRSSKFRRTPRVSRQATLAEKLAQTYRHVPFRTRIVVAAALVCLGGMVILGVSLELGFHGWQPVATAEPVAGSFWPPSSILLPTGHSRAVYSGTTYITLLDPKSGSSLWSDSRAWGAWKSATRGIIKELRDRVKNQEQGKK